VFGFWPHVLVCVGQTSFLFLARDAYSSTSKANYNNNNNNSSNKNNTATLAAAATTAAAFTTLEQ
jgi:hypothetical protein